MFIFGLFLKISPEVLAEINVPRLVTTPIILPTETPTPTPTSALIIKPRVTTVVLPPTTTASPTATPTQVTTQEVLTSPTPQPTPTPEISSQPTPVAPSNIWQLTTIGLVAAIIGGGIALIFGKKHPPVSRTKKETRKENK